ncbi:hypothetical protein MMC34_004062 [Xylographa carneopallida]|nr:hypothetical protein [Xylographa carneopallida]
MERWFESEKPRGKRTLTYQDMRDVFVAYFTDSIKFCGEVREISANAICAQIWELRNDGEHSMAWREVYLETGSSDPHGCWSATMSDLMATASDIEMKLFKKSTEDKVKILESAGARLNRNKVKRKMQDSWDWDSVTEYEGDTEQEDSLRGLSKMTRLGLSTPDSGSKRPAENHLRRFHVPTPFISVWDSILPALQRGLRYDAYSSGNAYVAIIDAEQLDIGRLSEYAKAIRVREIVHELKNRGRYLDMRYWGSSEYLVYRDIPKSVMSSAILTTFSIDSLRKYIETQPAIEQMLRLHGIEAASRQIEYNAHLKATALPMSLYAGLTIGHFLAFIGLPRLNLELLALKMSWVWKFGGAANQEWKIAYLEGVQEGYRIHYRQQGSADPQPPVNEWVTEGQGGSNSADIDNFLVRRRRIQQILNEWKSQEMEGEHEE